MILELDEEFARRGNCMRVYLTATNDVRASLTVNHKRISCSEV